MAALCLKHATDLSNLVVHDLLLLFDLVSKNRLERKKLTRENSRIILFEYLFNIK